MNEREKKELEFELEIRKKLLDFYTKSGDKLNLSKKEIQQNIDDLLDEIAELLKKLKGN